MEILNVRLCQGSVDLKALIMELKPMLSPKLIAVRLYISYGEDRLVNFETLYRLYSALGVELPRWVRISVLHSQEIDSVFELPNELCQNIDINILSVEIETNLSTSASSWSSPLNEEKGQDDTVPKYCIAEASPPACIAFGGTLDGLHTGHMLTLSCLSTIPRLDEDTVVVLGLSTQEVLRKKEPNSMLTLPYEYRLEAVSNTLAALFVSRTYEECDHHEHGGELASNEWIATIQEKTLSEYPTAHLRYFKSGQRSLVLAITPLESDGVGIAGILPELRYLLVTPETIGGAAKVNDRRIAAGLLPSTTVVAPLLCEAGSKIASRIQRRCLMEILDKLRLEIETAVGTTMLDQTHLVVFMRYFHMLERSERSALLKHAGLVQWLSDS